MTIKACPYCGQAGRWRRLERTGKAEWLCHWCGMRLRPARQGWHKDRRSPHVRTLHAH